MKDAKRMNIQSSPRRRRLLIACGSGITALLSLLIAVGPAHASTATATTASAVAGAGPSSAVAWNTKENCINPDMTTGILSQSLFNSITGLTGVNYNCLSMFSNPASSWWNWEQPWMLVHPDGFSDWLGGGAQHQMVLSMDLVPQWLGNPGNPLSWEQPCANGDYDSHAVRLAENLVSYGAGSIVIRLGPEANGNWESDYTGNTDAEMSAWAQCFDSEVSAMRSVPGAYFKFLWNPNVCTYGDIPLSAWYPGDRYVSIIGADAYDIDCYTLETVAQEGWQAYYTDSASPDSGDPGFPSLANMENFAVAHGKPMSFPEWGMSWGDDDPAYVSGMADMFHNDSFAFQSYYDGGDGGIAPLGWAIPQATSAYKQSF
jgi:hypothetical protein